MKKKQLHEALAVLLTKLSSARDNPLLMDNYAVKALRTALWSSGNTMRKLMSSTSFKSTDRSASQEPKNFFPLVRKLG